MPVTIINGQYGSSDDTIISRLEEQVLSGQAYIITPTTGGALTIRRQLVKKGPLIGNRVMSMHELSRRIAEPHPVTIPKELRLLLIWEIAQKLKNPPPTLSAIAPLSNVITAVKRNMLTPPKSGQMFNIYDTYFSRLEATPFIDDSQLMETSINKIAARTPKLPLAIGFVGFPRFAHGDISIIEAINKHYPDTDVLIAAPFLPNEKIDIKGDTESVTTQKKKAQIKILSLPSATSERRFHSQMLTNNEASQIVVRMGFEGSTPFAWSLKEQGIEPSTNPEIVKGGSGYVAGAISKLTKKNKKLNEWCKEFLNAADSDDDLLIETISNIETWSSIVSETKIPKHIFVEILQMIADQPASLSSLSSAYPFTWSLFEDGIFDDANTIIGGLIAGAYPRTKSDTHPLATGWWSGVINDNPALLDEQLFLRLIHNAKRLTLTYPESKSDGKETFPSPFLNMLDTKIENTAVFPLIPDSINFNERLDLEKKRDLNELPSGFTGKISSKEGHEFIRTKMGSPIKIRVTALEKFANCPFDFFVHHILGIRDPEEEGFALLPIDKGNIAHKVLSECVNKEFLSQDKSKWSEKLDEIIDGIETDRPDYIPEPIWKYEKDMLKRWCLNVMDDAVSSMHLPCTPSPFKTEWAFGTDDTDFLTIRLKSGEEAFLSGRVDRIDASKDKALFSIVDYKSGKAHKAGKKNLEDGTHLQIPLYMDAVEKILLPGAQAASGFFYELKDNKKKLSMAHKEFDKKFYKSSGRNKLKDDEWQILRENIRLKSSEYIENILNGVFTPNTEDCSDNCRVRHVCRYGKTD